MLDYRLGILVLVGRFVPVLDKQNHRGLITMIPEHVPAMYPLHPNSKKIIEKSFFVIYCYVSLSLPKSLPHILLLREIKRNPNDSNNICLFEFCANKGKQNKVYIMFLQ